MSAPADDLARLRAEMDQAKEGVKELAGALAGFFVALVGEGLTEGQALALTQTYLSKMIDGATAAQVGDEVMRKLLGESDG